uniref:G protein-coupled receptor n=1 Tax=Caenorhabditis tropicalis TaxID=1561998 RepID=A0A1I7U8L7_9PELO
MILISKAAFQGYHFFAPFFISSPCELIINKRFFIIGHILVLFFLTAPMMFPIGFSIERFIATGMASRYQKSSLSTKYAMEEITQSSKFTLIVTFTHLLFFGVYTACSIFVRVLGQPFFGSFINFYVARGVNCAVPTYNLVIVIVGMITLRHLNTKRFQAVQATVRILSIGNEGARNYDDAITNQWATITASRV